MSGLFDTPSRPGDIEQARKRFSDDDFVDLGEISDPNADADETRTSIRETLRENALLAIVGGLAALLGTIAVGGALRAFIPNVLSNPYVLIGLALTGTAGLAYRQGITTYRARQRAHDELVLHGPEGPTRYRGRYVQSNDGDYPLFIPMKGRTWSGKLTDPYTIGDMGAEIARNWSKANRDLDDPAIIRLKRSFAGTTFTDSGIVVSQQTDAEQLKIDGLGREASLTATMPDTGTDAELVDVKERIDELVAEKKKAEKKASTFKRQRDNILEDAQQPIEELVDERIEFYERIETARGRTRTSADADPSSNGASPPQGHDPVDLEVSADD